MNKIALAAAATAVLGTVTSPSAFAGSNLQGPLLTGIALETLETSRPSISSVSLPHDVGSEPRIVLASGGGGEKPGTGGTDPK